MNNPINYIPQNGCYVCLEGLGHGNKFITTFQISDDPTKSAEGEIWYKILGYAPTHEQALRIIYPTKQDQDRALVDYVTETLCKMYLSGAIEI